MAHPGFLQIDDFDYSLPDERIALYPLPERDQSRLLIKKAGHEIKEDIFQHLPHHIPERSLLILNNTKVIRARLVFFKASGARIEIFCLDPVLPESEMQLAFTCSSPVTWNCLIGNAKRWKAGLLTMEMDGIQLSAKRTGENLVEFSWSPDQLSFSEIILKFGHIPLPPYINREPEEEDNNRYQTIFARNDGSVAAPTAGLHFTDKVFEKLHQHKTLVQYLTLHVGAGTFKPVSSPSIGNHEMHAESVEVNIQLLKTIASGDYSRLIAVGTTSVRTLESLYWLGLRLLNGAVEIRDFVINQWEPYEQKEEIPLSGPEAINLILQFMEHHKLTALRGHTSLMIAPGYKYRLVQGMVTNFHQPKSTLLLLVSAFIGEDWKSVYQFALQHKFRFLSYGDSCLFLQ